MRLLTYASDHGPCLGILLPGCEDQVIPVPDLDMASLLRMGAHGPSLLQKALESGSGCSLQASQILAPLSPLIRNVFCLGWNYAEHSREGARLQGKEIKLPERPVFFSKATTSLNTPFGEVSLAPQTTQHVDWEVELGVVIGREGKNIPQDQAMEHIFGYTVINDVSARDVQTGHGGQFFKGKSLDGFCPMGPWIATRDEIPDPHRLELTCHVNGILKQAGNTRDLIFDIPAIIAWLSQGMTLLPGDIIATGTPAGVGFARTPPEFLRPGDVVECAVEGIGRIRNRFV